MVIVIGKDVEGVDSCGFEVVLGGLPPGFTLSPSSKSSGKPSMSSISNGSMVVRLGNISPVSGSKSTKVGGLVANGPSGSSFDAGGSVTVAAISSFSNSISPSTVVNCFLTKIATHRPYNSSNRKVSVISAITIPAKRIAPMNLT